MKIALIQLKAADNKEKNIAKAILLAKQAIRRKAKFILLPEVFNYRGKIKNKAHLLRVAESLTGASLNPFKNLAKQYRVHILAGSVYERAGTSSKAYNTSVLINPQGHVAARYRKIHLFDAQLGRRRFRESEQFRAGRRAVTASVGGFKIGLSVCYDLRFPAMYRRYFRNNVDMVSVPSVFTKTTGQAHWETLLRARAIENVCYVLAPNQVGIDGRGITAYGHSMVVDPWGRVLARASGTREEIVYAYLDKKILKQTRAVLPSIKKYVA